MAMWKAMTKDGNEVSEITHKWEDVKNNIKDLVLIINSNQVIRLPSNAEKYVQFKSASSDLGSGRIQIEERIIGFSIGNTMVKIRVNENTNNISVEI